MKMFAIVLMLAFAAGCGGGSGSCEIFVESADFTAGAFYGLQYSCDETGYFLHCNCPPGVNSCLCGCGEMSNDERMVNFQLPNNFEGQTVDKISKTILGHHSCIGLGIPYPY